MFSAVLQCSYFLQINGRSCIESKYRETLGTFLFNFKILADTIICFGYTNLFREIVGGGGDSGGSRIPGRRGRKSFSGVPT